MYYHLLCHPPFTAREANANPDKCDVSKGRQRSLNPNPKSQVVPGGFWGGFDGFCLSGRHVFSSSSDKCDVSEGDKEA